MSDDCPDKFKILVNDRIRAHHRVEENRKQLFSWLDENKETDMQVLKTLKKTVESFELNRAIYRELDYYQEHREILGEHPIFAEEMRQRQVDEMSVNDAHRAYRNIATYISKERHNLKQAKTKKSKALIETKIKEHQMMRELIAEKLGLDEK